MKFNIYGRFQIRVERENERWEVYCLEPGRRARVGDIVIPPDVKEDELAIYLDDIYHEYAGLGQTVEIIPD